MAFVFEDMATIRDRLLRDIRNLLPGENIDISSDSDYYVRASAVASVAEGLYQHQAWIIRQIFPDTADSDYLRLHAGLRKIRPKEATYAEGSAGVTGTPGVTLPAGSVIRNAKRTCRTLEATVMLDGITPVKIQSSVAGIVGNASDIEIAELVSAPMGINGRVQILTLSGGTDEESDASILARLLDVIRRPPAGGNRHDYRRWALEVPGVTGAYVYPLRRGLGTVDIAITSAAALPSESIIKATQAHIDDSRPVTARGSLVLAPTQKIVDFDIVVSLEGITLDSATASITEAIQDAVSRINPGQPLILSHIEMLISLIPGIADRDVVMPTGNVIAIVDTAHLEWLVCGHINVRTAA
ncbi:MAG: baseplate J/gp47 family protein [Plesiomonas sp.]|uniref:baseplate J/gp47 family protein n=1 Tax=Plesiomonas sp. TaxID=2486279 RepID=UPI003F3BF4CD